MSKLQSDFTTPEQSKRLLELGVPKWTANYYYEGYGFGAGYSKSIYVCPNQKFSSMIDFPCWSVGRLIEILKVCIIDKSELEEIFEYLKDCIYTVDALLQMYKEWKDFIDFSKLEE